LSLDDTKHTSDEDKNHQRHLKGEKTIYLPFLWAIKTYQSPISAGGVAFDSCSSSDQIIENILSFETCKVTLGETNPVSPRNLLAYVGPDRSSQISAVSSLLYEMNKCTGISVSWCFMDTKQSTNIIVMVNLVFR
jgi:hypothetical protein